MRELFDERSLPRPRVAAVTDSLFDAVAMLVESDCLARLPRAALAHPLIAGRLVGLAQREEAPRYRIALVHKAGRSVSREAQTLSAMLASFARVAAAGHGRRADRHAPG